MNSVDITLLQLAVAAGKDSYRIASECGWSLDEVRSQWSDYCGTSVFNLLLFEHALRRLPTKAEVDAERETFIPRERR